MHVLCFPVLKSSHRLYLTIAVATVSLDEHNMLKQQGLTLITKQAQALQFLSEETSLSGFQHGICMAKSLLSIAECLCDGLVGI